MKTTTYTFLFAFIVCVVCSVLLSAFSEGLRHKQELNAELDVRKNILKAVRLKEPLSPKAKSQEVRKVFEEKIQELVIDENGNVAEGKKPKDIKSGEKLYPLYIYKEDSETVAYCYPIVGYGLWSTLYGYFAVEADATTVRGITFYKHGETPGLGAEIEKEWFQNNFKGKKIWSPKENKLTSVHVVKGKAADRYTGEKLEHAVDGITAATITSNGVTKMLDKAIRAYEPYFQKIRKS